MFTAISLLFINKIQIKFLLSAYFYFDYTLFRTSVLRFLRALALHDCFHKLLSAFLSFIFISLHIHFFFFSFWTFLSFVSALFLFRSRYVFALPVVIVVAMLGHFSSRWILSDLVNYYISFRSWRKIKKKTIAKKGSPCTSTATNRKWNGTIYRIYRKSAIMIIILSANESKSNIARKFILMIDAFAVVATAATAAAAKDAAKISSQCIFNMP